MPTYDLQCEKCEHEWEDFFSITAPIPQECPKCKECGNVKRLISGGSGRGIVELSGHELRAQIKESSAKFNKEVHSSERLYSNILGETKYENLQRSIDKNKR